MEGIAVLAVIASLSAGGWLVLRRLRRPGGEAIDEAPAEPSPAPAAAGPPPLPPEGAMACPTCRREYAAGLRFCLQDARPLVAVESLDASMGESVTCRICRRSFEAGTRFCPFDADELGPPRDVPAARVPAAAAADDRGKICPQCTSRFGSGERFCGRDGIELVALN
jgi:hypothetical protein